MSHQFAPAQDEQTSSKASSSVPALNAADRVLVAQVRGLISSAKGQELKAHKLTAALEWLENAAHLISTRPQNSDHPELKDAVGDLVVACADWTLAFPKSGAFPTGFLKCISSCGSMIPDRPDVVAALDKVLHAIVPPHSLNSDPVLLESALIIAGHLLALKPDEQSLHELAASLAETAIGLEAAIDLGVVQGSGQRLSNRILAACDCVIDRIPNEHRKKKDLLEGLFSGYMWDLKREFGVKKYLAAYVVSCKCVEAGYATSAPFDLCKLTSNRLWSLDATRDAALLRCVAQHLPMTPHGHDLLKEMAEICLKSNSADQDHVALCCEIAKQLNEHTSDDSFARDIAQRFLQDRATAQSYPPKSYYLLFAALKVSEQITEGPHREALTRELAGKFCALVPYKTHGISLAMCLDCFEAAIKLDPSLGSHALMHLLETIGKSKSYSGDERERDRVAVLTYHVAPDFPEQLLIPEWLVARRKILAKTWDQILVERRAVVIHLSTPLIPPLASLSSSYLKGQPELSDLPALLPSLEVARRTASNLTH